MVTISCQEMGAGQNILKLVQYLCPATRSLSLDLEFFESRLNILSAILDFLYNFPS